MLSEASKAYQRTYQREYRLKRLARMHEHLGSKCAVCGSTDRLDIHHKDPTEKSFNPGSAGYNWAKTCAELAKCELLCEPCHQDKHGRTTHGTTRMYKFYKCRCDLCVEAWHQWQRAYQKTDEYKAWAREYRKRKYRATREEFLTKQRAYRRRIAHELRQQKLELSQRPVPG